MPQAGAAPAYRSIYSGGVVTDPGGNFQLFVQIVSAEHILFGYWAFASPQDEHKAYLKGYSGPERILLEHDLGMDFSDGITLQWVPGRNDTFGKIRVGSAAQHLHAIRQERLLRGVSIAFQGSVPHYTPDVGRKLLQHRQHEAAQHARHWENVRSVSIPALPQPQSQALLAPPTNMAPGRNKKAKDSALSSSHVGQNSPNLALPPASSSTVSSDNSVPAMSKDILRMPPAQRIRYHNTFGNVYDKSWESANNSSSKLPPSGPLRVPADWSPRHNTFGSVDDTAGKSANKNSSKLPVETPQNSHSLIRAGSGQQGPRELPHVRGDASVSSQAPAELQRRLPSFLSAIGHQPRTLPYVSPYCGSLSHQASINTDASPYNAASNDGAPTASFMNTELPEVSDSDLANYSGGRNKPIYVASSEPDETGEQHPEGISEQNLMDIDEQEPMATGEQEPMESDEVYGNTGSPSSPGGDEKYWAANFALAMKLPCMDCGLEEDHTWDCIGRIQLSDSDDLSASQAQQIADAIERFDPGPWTTHQGAPRAPTPEDTGVVTQQMAEIIRNENGYKEHPELHGLPDEQLLLCWAAEVSPNVEWRVEPAPNSQTHP